MTIASMTPSPLSTQDAPSADFTPRLHPPPARLWWDAARSFEDAAVTPQEWNDLVHSVGAPLYQTWQWCRTWWHHYGRGREARLFVFRNDHELVGILPMCIDTVWLGPLSLRIARLVGADHTPATLALPIRSAWLTTCIDTCLTRLVQDDRCEAVLLGPLSSAWTAVEEVTEAVRRRGDLVQVQRDSVVAEHGLIQLGDDFETWRSGLSRNLRVDLRRNWRRLQREHEITESVTDVPLKEFHAFAHMHATQWRAVGRGGHFADWPDGYCFNRSLVRNLAEQDHVRLYSMYAGSRAIVRQYAFVDGDRAYCRLSARLHGATWQRYGLGRLSLVRLAERLHAEGVRELDVGSGVYGYKQRLGAQMHDVRSLLLVANRTGVAGRARVFTQLAALLDRLYYRGWFLRVAPALRRPRRLWKCWVRSRV